MRFSSILFDCGVLVVKLAADKICGVSMKLPDVGCWGDTFRNVLARFRGESLNRNKSGGTVVATFEILIPIEIKSNTCRLELIVQPTNHIFELVLRSFFKIVYLVVVCLRVKGDFKC